MKRISVFLMCLLILLVLTNSMPPTVAQDEDECPLDEIREWNENEVVPLLNAYTNVDEDADDIETVAELQEFRRDFDDDRVPECAFPAKLLFIRMIDLRIDAIIALNLGDADLADDLIDDAEDAREAAGEALTGIIDIPPDIDIDGVAQIVSPIESEIVEHDTVVEGTYETGILGNNQLWVVLYAYGNGKYYPQLFINEDCDANTANSVSYGPRPGEWNVTAFIGDVGTANSGDEYDIQLYMADTNQHAAMIQLMAQWCNNRDYPGLSSEEFEPYGFEFITGVGVTRK